MRYHFEKPSYYTKHYGITYSCGHPIYNKCTLYIIKNRGLAVIQQRFNEETKSTYWTDIDPWLNDRIYLNEFFIEFFEKHAGVSKDGLYPTVTIRQFMHGLKLKPLPKEVWETVFDRPIFY